MQTTRQTKPYPSLKVLGRDITLLLAVKVVVLAVMFFIFFSPSHRLHPTETTVSAHLLGDTTR